MKKTILFILSIFSCVILFSCASEKKVSENSSIPAQEKKLSESKITYKKDFADALLEEDEIGKVVKFTGVLQKGNPCYFVEQNSGSRSAVLITITDTENSDTELSKLVGKKVTVNGVLISSVSPWNKTVQFLSVE